MKKKIKKMKKRSGKKSPEKHEPHEKHEKYVFHTDGGMFLNPLDDLEQNSTRQGFGEALVELGKINPNIVALTADLAESTKTDLFQKAYPERFFNVGIAEQNMLAISAGLAFSGKIPFATSFGVFATGRAWDQLRTSICDANANVKVAATHCGITVGEDGPTHQSLSDIAATRSLPHLTIIVPCDYEEAKKATVAAAQINGPVFLRLGRPKLPVITTRDTPFKIGKAEWYVNGDDVAIIACGELVYEALVAAKELSKEGIRAGVLNLHTIKPIDEEAMRKAAEAKLIVTAEDHHIHGGMGSTVAEYLAGIEKKPRQIYVGVQDVFGRSGDAKELMKWFHITSEDIRQAVLKNLKQQ